MVTKIFHDSGNILSENGKFNTVTYKYDNDKLVEKIEYDGGKPRIRITYKYTRGLLSEEIYEDIKSGRKWPTKYKYNSVGKIITKIRTVDDGEAIYNYKYIYW